MSTWFCMFTPIPINEEKETVSQTKMFDLRPNTPSKSPSKSPRGKYGVNFVSTGVTAKSPKSPKSPRTFSDSIDRGKKIEDHLIDLEKRRQEKIDRLRNEHIEKMVCHNMSYV